MKKLIWLTTIFLLSGVFLIAQSDLTPVVYSVSGKVKYANGPDAKFTKLRGGADLNPEGILNIYPGASLGIYYDEEYAVVSSEGEQKVADIIKDVDRFRESDLAELFGEKIDEAINPFFQVRTGFAIIGDPPPPPPTKGTKDGHGNKEYQIIRLQPTGGKVSGTQLTFRWNAEKGHKNLVFTLRSADDKVLLEKPVKKNELKLGLDDFRFQHGRSYKWQVSARDDTGVSTPNVGFEYAAPAALTELRNSLSDSEMYQAADPTAKLLIEASVLEQAKFLSEAHERYRTAAKKAKKNELAQVLFEAFQWRYDIIE